MACSRSAHAYAGFHRAGRLDMHAVGRGGLEEVNLLSFCPVIHMCEHVAVEVGVTSQARLGRGGSQLSEVHRSAQQGQLAF